MNYIVGGFSLFVFIKTIGYALYEQKENKNMAAAIVIYILAFLCLILPNLVMHII